MRIQELFKADIDRQINGVIKVVQDDEASIKQELEEYVITKELRRHFVTFLNNYERSITTPTDKIGVWISGFFGSGKSHFLKILSYLLSSKIVAGKPSVDYFADKFDDPMLFAQLEQCASVETDTILFNIDSKSPINKDKTAILRVFAKVFYEHLGFYGNDLKVAKLEQFTSKAGKFEEFKACFEEINGSTWEDARDAFAFFEDDIVEVLGQVLGMSESAARNWFNGTETGELSIEQLVSEIREYVNARGKNYRLLFMIDEVGQYIGSDSDLMLNLQTIVEDIGAQCDGRVWVMVTSQEAIDSIVKISGNDFSKIQGRFNTRLSLSSSSVDEVIKRRILAKSSDAEKLLGMNFDKYDSVLRNLFSFSDAVLDLKGYADAQDFVETYPFVPYQFRLMQNVLAQIRKHGNSGKHLSGGERSMLSGFQEAAQAIEMLDDNALISFNLFYNTVHTFLESTIRRVIDRCQQAADNRDGIEPYDVEVLKLLYLIRYVEDIKPNVDNITTLMVHDIRADKINMRRDIQLSLDRLLSQNYISRNGDSYMFLTDDEQDIAREIRQTSVDSTMIVQAISGVIYSDLYVNKKYKYGKYDFGYDQYVDDTCSGSPANPIRLRILTPVSDMYNAGSQTLILRSKVDNEAIVLLSDKYGFYDELEAAMQIRKYVKGRNLTQLPESIQAIIRGKQQEATAHEKRAKELISSALLDASFFISGEHMTIRGSSVKEKLDTALAALIESVYDKLNDVRRNYDSDLDILKILNGNDGQMMMQGMEDPNAAAITDVSEYLSMQQAKMLPTSMGDIHRRFSGIPYGWRDVDIAAIVATLIHRQELVLKYSGNTIQTADKRMPDYLRKRTEIDKAIIEKRISTPPEVLAKVRSVMRDFLGVTDIPSEEDLLLEFIINQLSNEGTKLNGLLTTQYVQGAYPGKAVVEDGITLMKDILSQRKDNLALFKRVITKQDDLLDHQEDIGEVNAFFKSQKPTFDSAMKLCSKMRSENVYIQADHDMQAQLSRMESILKEAKPYKHIGHLPDMMQYVRNAYESLLKNKREEVLSDVQAAMGEIHQTADHEKQIALIREADTALVSKRDVIAQIESMTELDAMKVQIGSIRTTYIKRILDGQHPVGPDPIPEKKATISRSALGYSTSLKSDADIDKYVEEIRRKLKEKLTGNDVLHII